MDDLRALLARTVASLDGVPDEALATMKKRRLMQPRLVASGRAWRLGVLLLARDGSLYATGTVTRAIEPQRGVANKSAEAEARRDLRRAAVRGRFTEGEVVNFDHVPINLDDPSPPLAVRDGELMVRWNESAERALAAYLSERVDLLRDAQ